MCPYGLYWFEMVYVQPDSAVFQQQHGGVRYPMCQGHLTGVEPLSVGYKS